MGASDESMARLTVGAELGIAEHFAGGFSPFSFVAPRAKASSGGSQWRPSE
jgi:hypothetical protein